MLNVLSIENIDFEKLMADSLDELPEKYVGGLTNVLITYEDMPTSEQQKKLGLRCDESLFGLYEGIPRTKRSSSYNLVLPDKITLFTHPLLEVSSDKVALKHAIKHTLWHEIAHHYGLDHDRIHEIERSWKR